MTLVRACQHCHRSRNDQYCTECLNYGFAGRENKDCWGERRNKTTQNSESQPNGKETSQTYVLSEFASRDEQG